MDLLFAIAFMGCAYLSIVFAFTTYLHLVGAFRLRRSYPAGARVFLTRGALYGLACITAANIFEALLHS